MKFFKSTILTIFLFPLFVMSATNDFVAGSDMTIADVTFGQTIADMIIFNGSTSEEISFDVGVFTVTNPASDFKVGSSDSTVKSMQISKDGSVVACSENITAGTSYATLPADSGIYTIRPSATTDCTDLCTLIDHTSTYNSFPTCGSATCSSGYLVSGSGADAICVLIDQGGIFTGTIPTPKHLISRMQTIYADGTVVYHDEDEQSKILPVSSSLREEQSDLVNQQLIYTFTNNLNKGQTNNETLKLQKLLRTLNLFKHPWDTGYYGTVTETAVKAFQCKYNIVCEGTPTTTGYGIVGPKTREQLNQLNSVQNEEVNQSFIPFKEKLQINK